jgi:hypothetical protein
VAVGGDLHLDVARRGDESFEVHAIVAERRAGLAAGEPDQRAQLVIVVRQLDPAAPAPGRSLDQHRVPHFVRQLARPRHRVDVATREHRHSAGRRRLPRTELVAGQLHHLGWRSDERQPMLDRQRRQARVLGQEPVAGVDRVAAGAERGLHDHLGPQVALCGRAGADDDRAVGGARGHPVPIDL